MKEKADREKTRWRTIKKDAERLEKETEMKANKVKILEAQTRKLKTEVEVLKKEVRACEERKTRAGREERKTNTLLTL